MARTKIIIMGAAGRDFHNFQVRYKEDASVEVVAFTATQIPGIGGRTFPSEIAGPLYPRGIPIHAEEELPDLIARHGVEQVVFAYSDVAHIDVMHKASAALAKGPDWVMLGPDATMLPSTKPVISVCAVRTGVGKSGITKRVWQALAARGLRAAAIRHPMPYRDLNRMRVERYASLADLDANDITVEEREEYEQLVEAGMVVFAGVDYLSILHAAEQESDVIIWDGGNNDMPFVKPDLEIVALDPHRPGHERLYHPGETNFLRADALVVNKVSTAAPADVAAVIAAAGRYNPTATVICTDSAIDAGPDAERIRGARVLVIEDGPTVTHGGMAYGAGVLAAREHGAAEIVDPRPHAAGSLAGVFEAYPHLTEALPAMGYSAEQLADLEASINATPCDLVLVATPIDLSRLLRIERPALRVTYSVVDIATPTIDDVVAALLTRVGLA